MINAPKGYEKFNLLSDPQQQIFQALLQSLLGQLRGEGKSALEAPILRQFQENIIPGLAERFAGLGAGGQSSSAFQQALGASTADLGERLGAISAQQQQGALSGLQGLLGFPTEGLVQKSKPWWQDLLGNLAGGIGSSLGGLGTGGLGALGGLLKGRRE